MLFQSTMYVMHEVGFEPTKLMQQILSLSPLTTRESVLDAPDTGLEPATLRLEVARAIQLRQPGLRVKLVKKIRS